MLEHIAQWNPTRQLWETPQADLFSEQSVPYSATWPNSGSMRNGSLFPPPTSAHPTAANEYSSSPTHDDLFPTPAAADGERGSLTYMRGNPTLLGALLPTPVAADSTGVRNATRGGDRTNSKPGTTLGDAVFSGDLLPTPTATPYGSNQSPSPGAAVRPSLDQLAAGPELLPTPQSRDHKGTNTNDPDSPWQSLPRALTGGASLIPTPVARDGAGKTGRKQVRANGRTRTDADLSVADVVMLLPTPEAKNAHAGPDFARAARDRSGGHDLVTALAVDADPDRFGPILVEHPGGRYGAAIQRWEEQTRPAPPPTEPNSKGNPRLNPAFSEWMMGWAGGWVTDLVVPTRQANPADGTITRNAALTIIGNGVVPQQAAHAIGKLLNTVMWRRVKITPDQL